MVGFRHWGYKIVVILMITGSNLSTWILYARHRCFPCCIVSLSVLRFVNEQPYRCCPTCSVWGHHAISRMSAATHFKIARHRVLLIYQFGVARMWSCITVRMTSAICNTSAYLVADLRREQWQLIRRQVILKQHEYLWNPPGLDLPKVVFSRIVSDKAIGSSQMISLSVL